MIRYDTDTDPDVSTLWWFNTIELHFLQNPNH